MMDTYYILTELFISMWIIPLNDFQPFVDDDDGGGGEHHLNVDHDGGKIIADIQNIYIVQTKRIWRPDWPLSRLNDGPWFNPVLGTF